MPIQLATLTSCRGPAGHPPFVGRRPAVSSRNVLERRLVASRRDVLQVGLPRRVIFQPHRIIESTLRPVELVCAPQLHRIWRRVDLLRLISCLFGHRVGIQHPAAWGLRSIIGPAYPAPGTRPPFLRRSSPSARRNRCRCRVSLLYRRPHRRLLAPSSFRNESPWFHLPFRALVW